MGTISSAIVVENVLDQVIAYLPKMSFDENSQEYPVTFGYGDEIELNGFLANREESDVYPLIWLLYPLNEEHTKTSVKLENASFILAVTTNKSMENKERIKVTYSKILMPLLHNLRQLFRQSNVISIYSKDESLKVVKHPNFSETQLRSKSGTIAIWDALKIVVDLEVIQGCIKPIKFFR